MCKKRPQPEEILRLKPILRTVSYMSYPDARTRKISFEFKWNVFDVLGLQIQEIQVV